MNISNLILMVAIAAVSSSLSILVYDQLQSTEDSRIKEFYETENAVHISPHSIRKAIMKQEGHFILVDLRSEQEYEKEHIVGAVNIPAYKDPDTSDYGDVERIVKSFKELGEDQEIIVYCYSMPCMTGRKIGKMLAEHGIYVKHLGVGWNEWRHHWTLWNHEHEWSATDVKDFIASGKEPGQYISTEPKKDSCPINSEFGC